MSLLDTLRSGVAIANSVTRSIQPLVTYHRMISPDDGYGNIVYTPTPVQLHAIVDWKQTEVRTSTGILTVSRASVMFLDIQEVNNATNGEGFQDEDKITLPDGTSGPILDMGGFIDAGTGHPLATEIFLG